MSKILIIEDDAILGEMLKMYLSEENFQVMKAVNGKEGITASTEFSPDLILLDMVLPDLSGIEICQEIRKSSTVPILIVSMKSDISDRIDALNAGADDYLCKPFSMRELSAKIAAMLRRTHYYQSPARGESVGTATTPAVDSIRLDVERRSLFVNNYYVETTFSEFELMKLFVSNKEKVFSREDLINELRGFDSYVNDRAIDVHIANLRKKIEEKPKEPQYIRTVWGVGYKFSTD